jgi:hypothetical protein
MELMVSASVIACDAEQALAVVERLTRAMLALALDGRHVSVAIYPVEDAADETDGADGGE